MKWTIINACRKCNQTVAVWAEITPEGVVSMWTECPACGYESEYLEDPRKGPGIYWDSDMVKQEVVGRDRKEETRRFLRAVQDNADAAVRFAGNDLTGQQPNQHNYEASYETLTITNECLKCKKPAWDEGGISPNGIVSGWTECPACGYEANYSIGKNVGGAWDSDYDKESQEVVKRDPEEERRRALQALQDQVDEAGL
jgi:hypothetical protein